MTQTVATKQNQQVNHNDPPKTPAKQEHAGRKTNGAERHLVRARESWERYQKFLQNMSKKQRKALIREASVVLIVGSTVSVTASVYRLLPIFFRIFVVPVIVVGSYIIGRTILGPWAASRLDKRSNNNNSDRRSEI